MFYICTYVNFNVVSLMWPIRTPEVDNISGYYSGFVVTNILNIVSQ